MHLRKEHLGARHRFRVCRMHNRALFEQALDHFQRGSEADVVRIGLEGQAQDSHALSFNHPKGLTDFLKKTVNTLFVDAFGGLQDLKIHADGSRQVDECLDVLRKTESTVAQTSLEELSADARVETHGVRDFFHVCADFFAEVGDHVRITDFQGEKRVGGVLDEFRAVDGGDQKFGFTARGARSLVHRTAETPLENRAVDFAEFRGGGRILDANNNAVRMEKISDGSAFAKKLRIRGHAEFYVAVLGIRGQGAAQFEAGARRNGAFFNDEFRRFRLGGNLAGNVIDGREVRFSGILRRSADTNEDGVSGTDGFTGFGGIGNLSSFVSGREDLVEVMFVDRNATGIQLGNAFTIDVRANYFVSRLGKTSPGDKTHITATDDRKAQAKTPFNESRLVWTSEPKAAEASLSPLYPSASRAARGALGAADGAPRSTINESIHRD